MDITGILFLCACGQHPYESRLGADAEVEVESVEDAGTVCASTSTTPLKAEKTGSAAVNAVVSWNQFREERGEGTFGHTVDREEVAVIAEVERLIRAILSFEVGG